MTVGINPIEAESYRILASRADLSRFGPLGREVVARVIHASADLEYASTMVLDDAAVRRGVDALRGGAPVVTDVEMTRAGISGVDDPVKLFPQVRSLRSRVHQKTIGNKEG